MPLQTREGEIEEQRGKSETGTFARAFLLLVHGQDSKEEGEEMALMPWL